MAEIDDIINTIIAEALGEGDEGMRRVGETILNRAAIRGLEPTQIVRQPHQYTGYFAPGPEAVRAQQDPIARSAAEAAWNLARQPGDPTQGADHYFNPNVVNPGWQNSMQPTGDYGDHSFYSSRPVPAEALASLLVPQSRNVPLPQPRPQSPMDQIAEMFRGSFDAPTNATTAAGLDDYINGIQVRSIPSNDMVFGDGFGQTFQRAGAATPQSSIPDLADTLRRMSTPAMPIGRRQYFAAQDRAPPPDMFGMNGDPGTPARGTRVATIPTRAPPRMNTAQMRVDTGQSRPQSNVGQAPTTRVVQSVPVPSRPSAPAPMSTAQARVDTGQNRPAATATRKPPLTVGATPSFAAMDSARPSTSNGVGRMPSFSDMASMFGNTPQPAGSVDYRKDQARLEPNAAAIDRADNDLASMLGMSKPDPVPVSAGGYVPLPRPRPVVSPQIAVTGSQMDGVGSMPSFNDFSDLFSPTSAPAVQAPAPQVARPIAQAFVPQPVRPIVETAAPAAPAPSGRVALQPWMLAPNKRQNARRYGAENRSQGYK